MGENNNTKPEEEVVAPAPEPTPPTPAQATTTPAPAAGPTNGLAIAALVTGIVAVITGWAPFWGLLVGAAAVVLGILGLKKATGKGMAIAGIITGGIGALWGLIVSVFFIIAIVFSAAAVNTVQQAVDEQNSANQALIDSKKDFAKGETANFANQYEVKVNSVRTDYNAGEFYTPEDGNQYIVVNVTIKNIGEESEYLSPYSFTLLDDGLAKTSTYVPVSDELEAGDLAPGATTTGNLVYEVSEDANNLKLQYDVTVFDQSYSSKKLTYTLAI